MDGEVREVQIRFAVTHAERVAWQVALKKRHLNGSSILRDYMAECLNEWHCEDTVKGADDARDA